MPNLILASSSPRRKELLSMADFLFEVIPSRIEEVMDPTLSPDKLVCSLAEQKARDVFESHPECVVLGADTIVVFGGQMLGKPKDREEAIAILTMLSGQTHSVYTGNCIISKDKISLFSDRTEVTFWPLTEKEILHYVNSGEPMDKAGGYGIQGRGATLVQSINGDFYNVMGLPISKVVRELESFGISAVSQRDIK
ncbi:Maf family protein [Fictibacillus sp. Mic-4]|uniref:Maf family protein n=1 Tax=Fictibacillus TaxID=1329200 RepID=UPI00041CFC53|nr:Maf family protein [Fictibacillus gelatini]